MPAANDHLDDALVLVGDSGEVVLNFTGADYMEPDEEDWWGGQHKSLWFLWTASFTGVARFILTDGAPNLWDVVVFANVVGWNFVDDAYDDIAWSDQGGADTFSTVAGTTYLIFADDYSYERGSLPRTSAVLSWQLLPFGTAGAMVEEAAAVWLPLHRRDFTVRFALLSSDDGYPSDYPWPGAEPPLHPGAQAGWTVGMAPEGSRLIAYTWGVLELTDAGDVMLLESALPLDAGYAQGWGGGGGDFAELLNYAENGGGYDYYGDSTADAAGRSFVGELKLVYSERTQRYRSPVITVPLSPAPAAFSVLSDVEAGGAFSPRWSVDVMYHRSRPGDVEPTVANTGPFGNPYATIHAVSGTQVGIGGGDFSVYSTHSGVLEHRVTGVADDAWHGPYSYVGLVGPNLPGVTESIVTLRSHYPGNPAAKEEFSFTIAWE